MTDTSKAYKEALAIMAGRFDAEDLAIKLAQSHPTIFVRLVNETGDTGPDFTEIDQFLSDGQKIHAIKAWRAMFGDGLREAKEGVEARMQAHGWGN